jgi:hypothetical protein
MQCVAQGAPYVIGSLAALRVMGSRSSRRRDVPATGDRSEAAGTPPGGRSAAVDVSS